MSTATLAELQDIFNRPKFDTYLSLTSRITFLNDLIEVIETVEITQPVAACRDPKDDKFLEVAVTAVFTATEYSLIWRMLDLLGFPGLALYLILGTRGAGNCLCPGVIGLRQWFTIGAWTLLIHDGLTMKAPNVSPVAGLILKLVGFLLVLSFLLDCVVLLSAAKFQDATWLLAFTNQLIDRGFMPLVGLALLFTGFWVEAIASDAPTAREPKLAALLLSSVLGLVFLVLIPININSTRTAADATIQQIGQEASNAQQQLDAQVKQQLETQLAFLDQAIKGGQLTGSQLDQAKAQQEKLQKFKTDPKALEAQVGPQRQQELDRIKKRQQELEAQTRDNALRSGMRSGLNSLLLAIGYIAIGWTGLRQLMLQSSR